MVGLVNDGTDEGMRGEYGIEKISVRGWYGIDNIAGREPRSAMATGVLLMGVVGFVALTGREIEARYRSVAPMGPRTRYRIRGP